MNFKDIISSICSQGDLSLFFRKALILSNLQMTKIARGGAGRGVGHVICAIMASCVRKLICDSPLGHLW